MVQPQEKYEHIGEEIKMMDLLADVCVCLCALCKSVCACVCVCLGSAEFLAATIGALLFMCMSFSELYI